jgi:hypothetical protein
MCNRGEYKIQRQTSRARYNAHFRATHLLQYMSNVKVVKRSSTSHVTYRLLLIARSQERIGFPTRSRHLAMIAQVGVY